MQELIFWMCGLEVSAIEKSKYINSYNNNANNNSNNNDDDVINIKYNMKITYVHCGEETRYKRFSQL